MKTSWIDIQQNAINAAQELEVRGVKVKVMLSPFDVPQSAESEFDEHEGVLILKFDYLNEREGKKSINGSSKGISFLVGRKSNRLYEIHLNAREYLNNKKIDHLNFELAFEIAEEDVVQYSKRHPDIKSRSFEAVTRVLKAYQDRLDPTQPALSPVCL